MFVLLDFHFETYVELTSIGTDPASRGRYQSEDVNSLGRLPESCP